MRRVPSLDVKPREVAAIIVVLAINYAFLVMPLLFLVCGLNFATAPLAAYIAGRRALFYGLGANLLWFPLALVKNVFYPFPFAYTSEYIMGIVFTMLLGVWQGFAAIVTCIPMRRLQEKQHHADGTLIDVLEESDEENPDRP